MTSLKLIPLIIMLTSCVTNSKYVSGSHSRSVASQPNFGLILQGMAQSERNRQIRTQESLNNWGGGNVNSGSLYQNRYAPTVAPSQIFKIGN